ncbi:MAG: AAA family ATPase [Clostridia bacterium]|nr:AAA family ATPase [Clostridia bacterium]
MFFAREKELAMIGELLKKPSGAAMIYGKRKVGKTTLLMHAAGQSSDRTVYYQCLRSTPEDNVEGFVRALQSEKVIPVSLAFKTFDDVFSYLNTLKGTFNIIIDEYPYLKAFAKPETIDSVFQSIIDNHLGNIRLFLSGSHVGMMNKE